jgi:hypothetical protein
VPPVPAASTPAGTTVARPSRRSPPFLLASNRPSSVAKRNFPFCCRVNFSASWTLIIHPQHVCPFRLILRWKRVTILRQRRRLFRLLAPQKGLIATGQSQNHKLHATAPCRTVTVEAARSGKAHSRICRTSTAYPAEPGGSLRTSLLEKTSLLNHIKSVPVRPH